MAAQTPTNITIKVNPQLLTSFPNQNDKTIDYVIVYEKPEDEKMSIFKGGKLFKKHFSTN